MGRLVKLIIVSSFCTGNCVIYVVFGLLLIFNRVPQVTWNDQKSILRPVFNSLDSKLCFIFSGETCKVDNCIINLYLKWCYIVRIRSSTNFHQGTAGHSNDQKSILRPVFNSLDSKLCFIFCGETCKVDNCIIN